METEAMELTFSTDLETRLTGRARRAASRFVLNSLRSRLIINSVDKIWADFYQITGTAVVEIGTSFPVALNVTLYEKSSKVEMI